MTRAHCSREVRRPFDERNLLPVYKGAPPHRPFLPTGTSMFLLHLHKKGVYIIKTSAFLPENLSRLQLPPCASRYDRALGQLEWFISDVFIFLPLYLTTTGISLTSNNQFPSLTRQTNWQCCQNRIQ